MPNIGGAQSSTENAIKVAASASTSAASSRGIYWPDRVVTLLLETVREKESLWNTKRRWSRKSQWYAYHYYSVPEQQIKIIVNIQWQCNFWAKPWASRGWWVFQGLTQHVRFFFFILCCLYNMRNTITAAASSFCLFVSAIFREWLHSPAFILSISAVQSHYWYTNL